MLAKVLTRVDYVVNMPKLPKYLSTEEGFKKEAQRLVKLRAETQKRATELNQLITLLEDNKELPEEVAANLAELKAQASALASLLSTSQTYVSSIETYYTSWSTTKEKIDGEYEEALEQNKTIKEYAKETANLKSKLTIEEKRAEALLKDARKTLGLVTVGSLSSVFQKRSDDRLKSRKNWAKAVIGAVILLAGAVIVAIFVVAADIKDASGPSVWVLKLALLAPFVYILYFVTKQYSHERDLEEKYAFKALVSQTIQNYTKLLRDEFINGKKKDIKEIEEKIIDFTVESLRGVYKEPYSTTTVESRIRFDPRKPVVEAESRQSENS